LPASASWLVPKALVLFKEASPKSSIAVRESTMDILLSELRLGNLDLIVGTLPTRQMGADLEETPLFDDATVLVAKPRHPLTVSKTPATWEQLANYPWVLPPHDSLLRQPLLVAFAAYGVEPPTNFVESLSLNVTLNYIQSSSAIASLPASLARKYSALGALAILPLKLPRLVRPVGMIWLKSHPIADTDRLFVTCVEEAAKDLAVSD
jgi:DNA-binding transcriptional LysR family regulator